MAGRPPGRLAPAPPAGTGRLPTAGRLTPGRLTGPLAAGAPAPAPRDIVVSSFLLSLGRTSSS